MYRKSNPLDKCQLKFSNDEKGYFQGYASVFNSIDKVGDTILPGSFVSTLNDRRPKMFINHDSRAVPVGDWLEMREDDHGLMAEGKIDLNHRDGPMAYSGLKRGALDGLSIGFNMASKDYESKSDGRIIKNLELYEVSLVNFPCEGQAVITAVKSDIVSLQSLSDCENYLRDVCGFSKSMARVFVSQVKGHARSDSDNELKRQIEEGKKRAHTALQSVFNRLKEI